MANGTPLDELDQGDYRLAQQCGADDITAGDVAANYRLDGAGRPIERFGRGWQEFGLEPGTVLETAEDVEGMRRLLAGRDPHTRRRLVKPKLAVAPEAKLAAAPFVQALQEAAEARGTTPAGLVKDAWSAARIARLERGLVRDGEYHRAPVADLERVAEAAGVGLGGVYGADELEHAREHSDERVVVGTRGFDVTFDRPKGSRSCRGWRPRRWPRGWRRSIWRRCASPWRPWSPGWATR